MSRICASPVKKWPGTVIISDPLSYPQLLRFREALGAVGGNDDWMAVNYAVLPGVMACIEEYHLQGFPEQVTAENWPATPPVSSAKLIAWLIGEINALMAEAEPDPNE
jgi:hypothetical protein